MSGPVTLTRFARDTFAALSRAWSQVWFQDSPTSPLELARIGIGAALLLHYAQATPHLFDLWGDAGWMPRDVVMKIRDPWMQSVFFYFGAPWEWVAFHGLFLLCCAAFMVGWRTSWVKWIVLVGQISYDYRNPMLTYGVDWIARQPALHSVCRAGRARVEPGQGARRARRKGQGPRGTVAALRQCLGRRLHPADADPDGGAVLLQRHQQTARGRLVERRRRMDRVHHRRVLQQDHPGRSGIALLAGQPRDLRYDSASRSHSHS